MKKWKLFATGALVLSVIAVVAGRSLASSGSIPASVTTAPAAIVTHEHAYRFYGNVDGLDPVTPLAAQNTAISVPSAGGQVRLRMSVGNSGGVAFPAGATFRLQFAAATSGPWTDVASGTLWKFLDNPSVADGQIIVSLLLTGSTVGESYGESNPSAAMPTQLLSGDVGEWDWSLVNASAATNQNWYLRMVDGSGAALDNYDVYPTLTAVSSGGGGGGSGGGGGAQGSGGGTGYYLPTSSVTSTASSGTGTITPPPLLPPTYQIADFNGDNRVDIIDLSILLFYYYRSDTIAVRYDLNHNDIVDFPDVSVLMFYWKE